jgi:hypothetical protein
MQLAILCGANPRAHKVENGANIRVHAGTWKVVLEGVKDSIIALQIPQLTPAPIPATEDLSITLNEGMNVRAAFTARGTEDYVSAYLELVTD